MEAEVLGSGSRGTLGKGGAWDRKEGQEREDPQAEWSVVLDLVPLRLQKQARGLVVMLPALLSAQQAPSLPRPSPLPWGWASSLKPPWETWVTVQRPEVHRWRRTQSGACNPRRGPGAPPVTHKELWVTRSFVQQTPPGHCSGPGPVLTHCPSRAERDTGTSKPQFGGNPS